MFYTMYWSSLVSSKISLGRARRRLLANARHYVVRARVRAKQCMAKHSWKGEPHPVMLRSLVWVETRLTVSRSSIPLTLPWSQSFYLCCQDVSLLLLWDETLLTYPQFRAFIQQFYQFVEGVSQHHSNIDDLLSRVRLCDYLGLSLTTRATF